MNAVALASAANVSNYDALYIVAAEKVLLRVKLSVAQETAYAALIAERPASAVDFLLGVLSQQTRYAKPRATVSEGSVTVRFCDAYTFDLTQADGSDYRASEGTWVIGRQDITGEWRSMLSELGGFSSREAAYEYARATMIDPAPWGTIEHVHALAVQCENDRALLTKTLKRIAKERFGAKLSVRGSTGTGWSWVHARPSSKAVTWRAEEIAALRLMNEGRYSHNSVSVRPCSGNRFATVCALAGHPCPEGHAVSERSWD